MKVGVRVAVIKNNDILKIIGSKIQEARKQKNYTQEFVAEKIDKSIDIYRSIENGRSVGSVATLLNICNVLEITMDDIFYGVLNKKDVILDKSIYSNFQELNMDNKELINIIVNYMNKKEK